VRVPALLAAALLLTAPRVQVVTMGEGDALYERFGHAALRVTDERSDLVYNFGTTDFNQPHLFREFLRGHVKFWVSVGSWQETIRFYSGEDRSIWLQDLHLSEAQQQWLADRLRWQALPQNRYYDYDHFWDNCTTRVRDLVDQASGGVVRAQLATPWPLSIRELSLTGFHGLLGMQIGTDVLLGPRVDKPITRYDAAFLPRIMRPALQEVKMPDGAPLGSAPIAIYTRRAPAVTDGTPAHAGRYLLAGIAVALLGLGLLLPRPVRIAFVIASVLVGLGTGVLALYSTVSLLRPSPAVLLFWPTDFALLIPRVSRPYASMRLVAIALVAALVAPPWEMLLLATVGVALFWIRPRAAASA
jgi:hypothetical protein